MNRYFRIVFTVLTVCWYLAARVATFNSSYGHDLYVGFCRQVAKNWDGEV